MKSSKNLFKINSIGIEVTWNCNQRCSYCYLSCNYVDNSNEKDITPSTFEKILSKIWKDGIRDIYLIGGEPSIHPDYFKLLSILDKYNWKRKGICTNGVGFDKSKKDSIVKYFDYVSVSIRGTEKTTKKVTRNNNSFRDTYKFLKYLSKHSQIEIRIALDLLPQYLCEFDSIIKSIKENNIRADYIDLHRIAPIGSAGKDHSLSIKQYKDTLKKIHNVSNAYITSFEDALPLCLFNKKYWKYINTCQCGISKLWIDPYGNTRRCACSSGSIGNVLEQSLNDICNSDILKDFQSFKWLPDECKKCTVLDKCLGGCSSSRGVKYFKTDIFSDQFSAIKKVQK